MSTKKPKISKIRQSDPFFEREKTKYEFPLPSREYIIEVLGREGVPLELPSLFRLLDIQEQEREAFARRLRAMEREGQVLVNRKGAYLLPSKVDLIAGRIEGHADGYGFLVPDDGSDDLYLDSKQMNLVLHRDRALCRVTGLDRKGRREGAVVEVLERANTKVVGRVLIEHGVVFVVPENRRIGQDILIPPEMLPQVPGAKGKAHTKGKHKNVELPAVGQVVVAEIIEQPTKFSQPIGRILEVLGNYADPGMEIEIALRKHDLPFEFPPAVEAETAKLPDKVRKSDWKDPASREDLRDLPLVTIDGETARDFDDAVFAERVLSNGRAAGWRLVVAIADVSHYVKPGMALDKDAYERGNSVYFPRRVIPMLPEKLSNGLCSLNPDVERLAMVCDMQISTVGKIKSYRFYPAVFRSRARLTYNQVWGWLSGEKQPETELHQSLQPHLQALYKLFQVLLKARQKRGAIDFETTETMMLFNENGKIDNIVPVVRNDAHRLIEECMLAANVCSADFLHVQHQAGLYRIHEGPTPEKLDGLRDFLREFGLSLGGGDDPHALDYGQLLSQIKGRPDAQLLQTVMLRSLRQAMYSPDNVGHFGLAYESYTHFTSPIRRYPDLLVHRAIKAALNGTQYHPHLPWDDVGLHCSMTERRADEATRDVDNWLKCFFMKERIGEEFEGTIVAVVPFGVFVGLDDVYVEGLVHVTELGQDYFQFDKTKHQMLGERTGRRYRLGDRLRVRLVKADLETGRIDFVLADGTAALKRGPAQLAGKPGSKAAGKGGGREWSKPAAPAIPQEIPRAPAKSTGKAGSKTPVKAAPAQTGDEEEVFLWREGKAVPASVAAAGASKRPPRLPLDAAPGTAGGRGHKTAAHPGKSGKPAAKGSAGTAKPAKSGSKAGSKHKHGAAPKAATKAVRAGAKPARKTAGKVAGKPAGKPTAKAGKHRH